MHLFINDFYYLILNMLNILEVLLFVVFSIQFNSSFVKAFLYMCSCDAVGITLLVKGKNLWPQIDV